MTLQELPLAEVVAMTVLKISLCCGQFGLKVIILKSSNNVFSGFSPELLDFLFELRFSNTIEKQADNLVRYKKLISEPLTLLYEAMLDTVLELNLPVETKPSRCMSTPYTDRRFSPNVPLKEYMYIRFKQYGKETDILGLYFDMGIEYYGYGIRIYKQTSRGMDKLREKMLENLDKYSVLLNEIYSAGFAVVGEKYKKDHYPKLTDCLVKYILNHRGFYIEKAVPVGDNVFSSALADELSEAYRKLSKLFELLEE